MNESSRVLNVAKNTVAGVIQRVVTVFSGFLIQLLYIRKLGIEYVGVSALFTSIISVLSLAELGFGTAITYSLYKPVAENDLKRIAAYVRFYEKTYRVIAGIILIVGLLVTPWIGYWIKEQPKIKESLHIIFLLILADTVLSYLLVYKSTLLIAAQKNRIVANVQTLACVVKCFLIAIVLVLWKNYYLALVSIASITVLQNVIISRIADKEYPEVKCYRNDLQKSEIRELVLNVRATALYKVSGVVLHSTDNLILASCSTAKNVGILSNYNLVTNNVYNLIAQFYAAVSSGVGNLGVDASKDREYSVFRILNFITFWVYSFCAVSILTLVQQFIELFFGNNLCFPWPVVAVLVLDFFLKGMLSPVNAFRNSHGLFVQGKYRPLIMACMNVLLSLVLLKLWGLVGVFAATVISRLATQVWYDPWLIYRRVFDRDIGDYFRKYAGFFGVTCLSAAASCGISEMIQCSSLWIELCLRAVVCLIIPNLLVVLIYRKTEEFQKALAIVSVLLKRLRKGVA